MVTTTPSTVTAWTPTSHADYDRLKGQPVRSADAETLGTITAVLHPVAAMCEALGGHYVVITPARLQHQRWFGHGSAFYVPESAIAADTEDGVRLTYPTDQLAAQGWDQQPANLQNFHRV